MLSHADNLRMCQVGRETPMGKAMRRYWAPILASRQLPAPDCPPVRAEIMGEKLVIFRNSEGEVGVLDEKCCHRNASLALGRVEDCGIRCIFHGWLFAPDGAILETPNVSDDRFRARFRATAFPAREAGGFIWAYLGPKELEPPFPNWRYFDYPPEKILTTSMVVQCNYVQLLEALFDSSHLTILHQDAFKRDLDVSFAQNTVSVSTKADPRTEVEDTTFGFHYAALRPAQTDRGLRTQARVASFVAPFHQANANGDFCGIVVPINDNMSLHHFVWWSDDKDICRGSEEGEKILAFTGLTDEIIENFGLGYDTWHLPGKPNPLNNFHQDRAAMEAGSWSGLPDFFPEDAAILMSSDPIRDRSKETLAPVDVAVARLYRTYLTIADQLEHGEELLGLNVDPRTVRGLQGLVPEGGTWKDLVPDHIARARNAIPIPRKVEGAA